VLLLLRSTRGTQKHKKINEDTIQSCPVPGHKMAANRGNLTFFGRLPLALLEWELVLERLFRFFRVLHVSFDNPFLEKKINKKGITIKYFNHNTYLRRWNHPCKPAVPEPSFDAADDEACSRFGACGACEAAATCFWLLWSTSGVDAASSAIGLMGFIGIISLTAVEAAMFPWWKWKMKWNVHRVSK
jgi:hypothetical protein